MEVGDLEPVALKNLAADPFVGLSPVLSWQGGLGTVSAQCWLRADRVPAVLQGELFRSFVR